MLTITSAPADSGLAKRITDDLQGAGYEVGSELSRGSDNILIAVLSPGADADSGVQQTILLALDHGRHIIIVQAKPTKLPKLIDHLQPVDFSKSYDFKGLEERLQELQDSRQLPLKVLTPRARASNARIGLAIAALVLFIFVVGIWAIITYDIEAPQAEYDAMDTLAASTRDPMIHDTLEVYATFIPQSTEDAAQYSGTLRAVPTIYRPFVAQTATAVANESP